MRNTFHPIIAPIATTINEMFLRVIKSSRMNRPRTIKYEKFPMKTIITR
jgi:hypothetical protein